MTFLTRRSEESRGTAFVSALRVGVGAALLLGVLAVVIAAGGSGLARLVEFDSLTGRVFRLTIGLVVVVFGLRQTNLLRLRMQWLDRIAGASGRMLDPAKARNRPGSDVLYEFGYLLAGFG